MTVRRGWGMLPALAATRVWPHLNEYNAVKQGQAAAADTYP
jgi:hypothetical protein